MIGKEIATAAGELSRLFGSRDSDFPQDKLQQEISIILINNGIEPEYKEPWWMR